MASSGSGDGGDGGRRAPRSMQGLLRFCMEQTKNEDASGPSHFQPMSEEKTRPGESGLRSIITSPNPELARQNQDRALATLGLYRFFIPADGNCLFRAVAWQLQFGQESYHPLLRQAAVGWMYEHVDDLLACGLLDSKKEIQETEKLGTWAGQAAVVALANIFALNIIVIQGGDKGEIDIQHISPFETAGDEEEQGSILLAYLYHGHYDAVVEQQGLPNPDFDKWIAKETSNMTLDNQQPTYVPMSHRLYDTLKGPRYMDRPPPPYPEATTSTQPQTIPVMRDEQKLALKNSEDLHDGQKTGNTIVLKGIEEKQVGHPVSSPADKVPLAKFVQEAVKSKESCDALKGVVTDVTIVPNKKGDVAEAHSLNVTVNQQMAVSSAQSSEALPKWRVIPIQFSGSIRKGRLPAALSLHRQNPPTLLEALGYEKRKVPEQVATEKDFSMTQGNMGISKGTEPTIAEHSQFGRVEIPAMQCGRPSSLQTTPMEPAHSQMMNGQNFQVQPTRQFTNLEKKSPVMLSTIIRPTCPEVPHKPGVFQPISISVSANGVQACDNPVQLYPVNNYSSHAPSYSADRSERNATSSDRRRRRRSVEARTHPTQEAVPSEKWLQYNAMKERRQRSSASPQGNRVPVRVLHDLHSPGYSLPGSRELSPASSGLPSPGSFISTSSKSSPDPYAHYLSSPSHETRRRRTPTRLRMSPARQLSWEEDTDGNRVPVRITSTPDAHIQPQRGRTVPIRIERQEPTWSKGGRGLGFNRGQSFFSDRRTNWFSDIERDFEDIIQPIRQDLDSWFY